MDRPVASTTSRREGWAARVLAIGWAATAADAIAVTTAIQVGSAIFRMGIPLQLIGRLQDRGVNRTGAGMAWNRALIAFAWSNEAKS